MNFGMITDELNMQETKQVIHSILNAGCEASIVIDRSSFEILYQNDKAIELMGNRVGMICHEVLCTKETPCMDCPMQQEFSTMETMRMALGCRWFTALPANTRLR